MAKGFTRDHKFIPMTDYKKVTRKSRDMKAKTQGVRMKRDLPRLFNHVHSSVIADRLGIDTDGFVGTYTVGTGKDVKIVGYKEGQTFTQKSVEHIDPKIKEYRLSVFSEPNSDYGKIFAVNNNIAIRIADDILLEELQFGKDFGLTRIEKKFIEVKRNG